MHDWKILPHIVKMTQECLTGKTLMIKVKGVRQEYFHSPLFAANNLQISQYDTNE